MWQVRDFTALSSAVCNGVFKNLKHGFGGAGGDQSVPGVKV